MDLRGWGAALVDLVLPTECAGCAAPPRDGAWCARCVVRLGEPSWPLAGGGLVVLATGRYSGPLRTAVLRYKERGRRDLATPLAQRLLPGLDLLSGRPAAPPGLLGGPAAMPSGGGPAAAPGLSGGCPAALTGLLGGNPPAPAGLLGGRPQAAPGSRGDPPEPRNEVFPGAEVVGGRPPPHDSVGPPEGGGTAGGFGVTWVVPAPSRPAAARARGGDHVLRLARALAAERLDIRVAPALALARRTRDSVGLDPAQRVANLEGRLHVRHSVLPPPGSCVLLLDDVVTTGATLRACRSALRNVGIQAGSALVLCDATSGPDDHEPLAAS